MYNLLFLFFTVTPTPHFSQVKRCENCHVDIPKNRYSYHLRTNFHKANCLSNTKYDNIEVICTAFKNRIISYKLSPFEEYLTPEAFLIDNEKYFMKIINNTLKTFDCIKVNFELFAFFFLHKTGEKQLKSFNTKYSIICKGTDIHELYLNTIQSFQKKLSEFQHRESGWSCESMSHLEININKYSPFRGGSYIDLPSVVRNTKSCLNIRNNDNYCFLWSIVAAIHPQKNNVCLTSSYPHYSIVLNTDGMTFPPSYKDIKIFENSNEISVNVYGLDDKNNVTGPLYITSARKNNHVNLLYIQKNGKGHYCLIKNLLRLVKRQVTNHTSSMYLCELCLQFFASKIKFSSHNCNKILTVLPKKNSYLQFKNYERQQKINFIIYADFESILKKCDVNKSENTRLCATHEPSCFGYYICCSHDPKLNKYVTYKGSDCVEVFVKYLIDDIQEIYHVLSKKMPMTPLTLEQENSFKNATHCHICKNLLYDDRVYDHDHITSEYRGAAHSHCNLLYRVCSFVPVVFHNLAGYDCHLFVRELAKYEGYFKIIPKTKEKYITITKVMKNKYGSMPIQIKFIDSFQFLNSSLDVLSKNLKDKDFVHLSKQFQGSEQLKLLLRKGIYPYEYMDSMSKYDETVLPPQECFYSSLKCEHISDDDYKQAQLIWDLFSIKSLGEYTDLYLKIDVLLLCDIFENFRNTCLRHYKLDPAYYVTASSLTWDAMLLYTGVRLELISHLEIYEFLEKGIRGGLAQCSLRNAVANNKYLSDFDKTQPSTFLVYLDCNNLYGFALSKKIPISDFRLLSATEIDNLDIESISDESDFGYILEVDLAYPEYLHNAHSDLPFAVEKFTPPGAKNPKLIANLYDKFNYVIHYVHLKECLKNGLIIRKIHRVLTFKQQNFLQKYIDLNTRLRQASTSDFEKDFFKLLNNAIFGKTIENKRKQANIKLVTNWNGSNINNKTNKKLSAEKMIAKPNLKNITVFSENLVAVHLSPEKIVLDRPIYIGFTVLEYAKQHLYKFHYDFIKNKYKNKARLCYTDTDSLLYFIRTEDFYQDMKNEIDKFDTSNFDVNNCFNIPRINAKIPGLFKDELGGDIITEFTGLRAKLYCIKSKKIQIKKAKGVSKTITKRLTLHHYNSTLNSDVSYKSKMNMIKSIKHSLYTQEVNKLILNRNDDKRQILPNNIETLPWGHCSTIF